jgi:hypothetical protein
MVQNQPHWFHPLTTFRVCHAVTTFPTTKRRSRTTLETSGSNCELNGGHTAGSTAQSKPAHIRREQTRSSPASSGQPAPGIATTRSVRARQRTMASSAALGVARGKERGALGSRREAQCEGGREQSSAEADASRRRETNCTVPDEEVTAQQQAREQCMRQEPGCEQRSARSGEAANSAARRRRETGGGRQRAQRQRPRRRRALSSQRAV